jgi:hypothetical protein
MSPQTIFRREYWKQFRIDLLRSRRDSRARKSLLLRIAFLIYCVAVLVYYYSLFHSLHDTESEVVMGFVLIVIFAIIAGVRFSQWRESQQQAAADIASVPAETTARVQHLAYGMAAVMERALGERWLQTHTVPEGATVVSRNIQIETLRKHGVWDEMPSAARIAMMEPDGSWPVARINYILSTGEKLNTLLWALALQPTLRPVEDLLSTLSMKKLAVALQKPAPGLRPTWDIRPVRNRAFDYFWRCYAEGVHRGDLAPVDETQANAVENWMSDIASHPQQDYLAGASTIRELPTDVVRQAGSSSVQRAVVLNHIMNILDGQDDWGELTNLIYAPLLPTQDADPAPSASSGPG